MKLELGSGPNPTPGYVHLDINEWPDVDIYDDAASLEKVDAESCDEIRACHLLEHFSHTATLHVLRVWWKRLKPGGFLYVEVPNLSGHVKAWSRGDESDEQFVTYLYGGQDYEGNFHRAGFTPQSLGRMFRVAGFRDIQVRDFGLAMGAQGTK